MEHVNIPESLCMCDIISVIIINIFSVFSPSECFGFQQILAQVLLDVQVYY